VAEVQRACDRLARPTSQPALGAAHYVRAELHRLRGEFAEAEVAYRKANQWGRQPQPGLAQLRLAQGRVDEAHATMRRVLIEAEDVVTRSRLLGPYVEVALGGGDVAAARGAAEELSRIAAVWSTPFLSALSSHATGSVLLAEGDARAVLAAFRRAGAGWGEGRAIRRGAGLPAGHWATRTAHRWSSTPRGRYSCNSTRLPTSSASRNCLGFQGRW